MKLKILISGAFSSTFKELAPEYEKATGTQITSELGASTGDSHSSIPNRLARGEQADVLILVGDDLDKLIASGKALPGNKADIARALIAAAIQSGHPKQDISTESGLKEALLAARAIGYSESASGAYVRDELFKRLGIEEQVKNKARMVSGKPVGEEVANGGLDFAFQQLAELMPVQGIDVLGLLPKQFQTVTTISAGVSANSSQRSEAAALIRFLAAPERNSVLKKHGLEPADYPEV